MLRPGALAAFGRVIAASVVQTVLIPGVVAAVVAGLTSWLRIWESVRKIRAERDEAHFSHRQSWYHRLLDAEGQWRNALKTQRPSATDPASNERMTGPQAMALIREEFRRSINGVLISGTPRACETGRALSGAYDATVSDVAQIDWDDIDRKLNDFIDAAQEDLGAPPPRPGRRRPR